jgi:hypothetical protein
MNTLVFFAIVAFAFQARRAWEERQRITLLGRCLRNFQIESLMETLTQGYLRAMGESDVERRQGIWNVLAQQEQTLQRQLRQMVDEVDKVEADGWRASNLSFNLPLAVRLLPNACFDMRALLRLHALGIDRAITNDDGLSERNRAFRLSAELLLLQHSCHWFCRSKMVASARMLARHHTHYTQLVAAVAPATRLAYLRTVGAGQGA